MSRIGPYAIPVFSHLQGFTGGINNNSPNASIPVAWLSVNTQQTGGDICLISKGTTGALVRQIPDSTNAGGNKRGNGAVDLQNLRTAAAEVASGNSSFLAGKNSKASGTASAAIGDTAYAIASGCMAIGTNVTATALYCSAMGYQSDSYDEVGANAHASGIISGASDAQHRHRTQRRSTANATPVVLTSDGGAPGAGNTVVIPNFSSGVIHAEIIARTGAGVTKSWRLDCTYKKQGAGTAAMLAGAAVAGVVLEADAGAAAWTITGNVSAAANNFEITATGAAATNIQWVAFVRSVEVRF